MNNFTLIAVIIIVLWLLAIGFYFYISRQQRGIAEEIDDLREKIDEVEDEGA